MDTVDTMDTENPTAFDASDPYAREIAAWRARRVAQLAAPDGWLALVGLEWLRPGPNRIGTAPDNDIVLAVGPAHLGTITLADDRARLRVAPGIEATFDDTRRAEAELRDDAGGGGQPTVVRFGTASLALIARDGRKGVRLRDSEAATRTQFRGLDYFPLDPTWRVEAAWVPAETARTLPIPTTLGASRERPVLGKAVFVRGGRRHELIAVGERADAISFVLADRTSGVETYGGARFLTPDHAGDGGLILDFNKATNPPCAFTPFATCPLAPPENRLDLRIVAGEKNYAGATH